MSDPYGAPQDDPHRAPPPVPAYQPGPAWTPPVPTHQPGPAYPPPGGYPPAGPAGPYGPYGPYGDPGARRDNRNLIVVLAGVAVVLLVSAVVIAVVAARYGGSRNSAGAGSGTPTSVNRSQSSTPPATTGTGYVLSAPDSIGALRKAADQSAADGIRNSLQSAGTEQTIAVVYQDTAAANSPVIIGGATGGLFGILDAQSQVDAFFNGDGGAASGGTVGSTTSVDPGSVGGVAECAVIIGQANATLCAWSAGDALVAVVFGGESLDQSAGQLPTILPAVVGRD
jgi:hypothetical protein